MNERRNSVLLWTIFVILVALLFVFGIGWAQDPCAACPDPEGFSCQMWPDMCYSCWEQCGQPIATQTPTRTPNPTRTPTPTPPAPTPTPVGPPCTLHATGPGQVYLIAIWAHEWPEKGKRWVYRTETIGVPPGTHAINPRYVEGYPIGYEWWDAVSETLLKSCGDTSRVYPRTTTPTPTPPPSEIFSDGFEKGNTSEWSEVRG